MLNSRVVLSDLETRTKTQLNKQSSHNCNLKKPDHSTQNLNPPMNTSAPFHIESFPKSPDIDKEAKFTFRKQRTRLSNINEEKNYLHYGLHKNLNSNPPSPSDILHEYLPLKYKNNEEYKGKLFKFLRPPQIPNHKTDFCKLSSDFSIKINASSSFDGNITKFEKENNLKRKKYISVKKAYKSELPLFSDSNEPNLFFLYTDADIGFGKKWQRQIHTTEMDDDVCTDSDQLGFAKHHIIKEINQGIQQFAKNKRKIRNYIRYHDNDDLQTRKSK